MDMSASTSSSSSSHRRQQLFSSFLLPKVQKGDFATALGHRGNRLEQNNAILRIMGEGIMDVAGGGGKKPDYTRNMGGMPG